MPELFFGYDTHNAPSCFTAASAFGHRAVSSF